MASKPATRVYGSLLRRSRLCSDCVKNSYAPIFGNAARQFSTTFQRCEQSSQAERPRWSYTPEQMKAPFNPRTKDPRKAWEVKEDPAKLDAMYNKFLGKGGEKALTEEIKWLAVTHKSFDQGRRGFNDRLAYFGKQLLTVECTLALLLSPGGARATTPDAYGREPFQHPDLEGLQNLDSTPIHEILSKQRLAQLATSYGIGDVTRWKPRNPANLAGSGSEVVYATSLYAILGALALQKGGAYAKQIARERVLKPLGI